VTSLSLEELKRNLATTVRLLEKAGHIDFNGHVSARIPGSEQILINDRRSSRSSLTEKDIIAMSLDGKVLDEGGEAPNEYPLHTQIYKKRKDVQAVIHTHPQWSTLFTIARVPLQPVVIQGAVLGEIPVFPKSHSISNVRIADELADTLQNHHVVLLKAHGAVIVGSSLMEAFVRSVFLEENARRQYMASQLGAAYPLEPEEIAETAPFIWQPHNIRKVWDNHVSKLEQQA
jgi:L-fuculose-phosphate aldolase